MTNNNDQIHICFEDGIFTINKEGNIINAIYSNSQELFGILYVDNDLVLVEIHWFISKAISIILTIWNWEKRTNIDGILVKILSNFDQEYFIILNQHNNSFIKIYDENLNILYTEMELLNCEVFDVIKLNNYILLGTSNGFNI